MKRNSIVSFFLVFVLLLTFVLHPLNTTAASDSSEKPNAIVLNFSFFDAPAGSDEYSKGANEFLKNVADIMFELEMSNLVDVNEFEVYAKSLQYSKIAEYLNQTKYSDPLMDYLQNDERGSSAYSDFETLLDFEKNFEKVFNSSYLPKLNEMLKEAEGKKKTQLIEALDLCNNVIKFCDCVLLILPDLEPAKTKKAEAQKLINKLMGSVSSSFYSSEVHKNNLGKILFSETNIVAGKENISQFSDKYSAVSNIYAIAYLPMGVKSIKPSLTLDDKTYIGYETVQASAALKIDGEISQFPPVSVPVNIQDYQANKGYITFEIIPNAKSTVGYNFLEWYSSLFSQLKPGNHTISIELSLNNSKVASGQFELDWNNADLTKIKKNLENCQKIASDYRANLRKVPEQFKNKHKVYKDAALSDAKIKAMFMQEFKNAVSISKMVNIGDNSQTWYVEKDDWDIPVAKYSGMETWIIYKAKDGWSYITQIKFKCVYEGGGVYGKPYILMELEPAKIATKNVK